MLNKYDRCKGKQCKHFYSFKKNIKLFSGFEFQMTARIAQHKSADHAILSVRENLHTIEQLGSYVPFLKIFPKCLNKVYESSASTFTMNDQLKGSK